MPIATPDALDRERELRRLGLKLGLRNGLLVGLALALGVWAPDAILLSTSHVRHIYPSLVLGLVCLLLLGGLAGWLTAVTAKIWAGVLIWLAAAVLMTLVIGHLPYEGRSWLQWLADRRSWGLSLYSFGEVAEQTMVFAGFFILFMLAFLGLIQGIRMESIAGEIPSQGRLTGRGWFMMLLPLPFVAAVGLVADGMVNKPMRVAPRLVHEAIETSRTYAGDLFALSLESGLNYNAVTPVRDQVGADAGEYTLSIGSVDLGLSDMVVVVADFDGGSWINCRVVADQLSYCYDASQPYYRGLSELLSSGQVPDDCPACAISVSDDQRSWLLGRSVSFAGSPHVTRLAQWGSSVLVTAESTAGDYALECRLQGFNPVRLESCRVTKGPDAGIASPPR